MTVFVGHLEVFVRQVDEVGFDPRALLIGVTGADALDVARRRARLEMREPGIEDEPVVQRAQCGMRYCRSSDDRSVDITDFTAAR